MPLTVSYKRDSFLLDNLRAIVADWFEDATGEEAMQSQIEALVRNIADEINDYKSGVRVKYHQKPRGVFCGRAFGAHSINEWIRGRGE